MTASLPMTCIVATELSRGIGFNGRLPWPRIKIDSSFLHDKTSITTDKNKVNAVVLGRLTWESLPSSRRPLKNRFNVVLSSRPSDNFPVADLVCESLAIAMTTLQSPSFVDTIESVHVLGGQRVYEEAMASPLCKRLYVTRILAEFPSDTFFPPVDTSTYILNESHGDKLVPEGLVEDNGIKLKFEVYDRV